MLQVAQGWSIVEARDTDYLIVYRENRSLKISTTDFGHTKNLIEMSSEDGPWAFDRERSLLYFMEHFCENEAFLCSVSLENLEKQELVKAPDGHSFRWLLCLSPDGRSLASYLDPTDCRADDAYLTLADLPLRELVTVPLSTKVFMPEDLTFGTESVLFITHGNLGLFNFGGKMLCEL